MHFQKLILSYPFIRAFILGCQATGESKYRFFYFLYSSPRVLKPPHEANSPELTGYLQITELSLDHFLFAHNARRQCHDRTPVAFRFYVDTHWLSLTLGVDLNEVSRAKSVICAVYFR